jgi:5'-nucleotidase
MTDRKPLILITNDDGIDSPGLAALAPALEPLGDLLIIAPVKQQTSMGRSRSQEEDRDGRLFKRELTAGGKSWPAFAVNATPALAVDHGLQQLADRPVSLVVSGINYGENVGSCVTVSGTIGAALEAADHGIPAIAASLEHDHSGPHDDLPDIDFSAAAHFVHLFAARLLDMTMPEDVDLLKIDIPSSAGVGSPWMVTHQDRIAYYQPRVEPGRDAFAGDNIFIHWQQKGQYKEHSSDAYALTKGIVSVTPLSLNLTSRTSLVSLAELLGQEEAGEEKLSES